MNYEMSEVLSQPNKMTRDSALLGTFAQASPCCCWPPVGQGKQFDFCLSAAVLVQELWELSASAFCVKKIKFSRNPGVQLGSQHRVQCLGAAGPFARTLPHLSQPIFAGEINGFEADSFLAFKVRSAHRGEVAQKGWLVIPSAALGQVRANLGVPENC